MEIKNAHNPNEQSFGTINHLLPAQTDSIIQSEIRNPSQQYNNSFCFNIFRFANFCDVILMIIGGISALFVGAGLPVFSLLWGNVTDAFINGGQTMVKAAFQVMTQFFYIGLGMLVFGFLMFACWMFTGQRQAIECRKQYLKSLLRQQIGWYDNQNQIDLATQFAQDSLSYQGAIGQKISTVLLTFGTLISGFTIAFVKGWHMALVSSASLPIILGACVLYVFAVKKTDQWKKKDYGDAGGVAEQAIYGIKTVKMLNGQDFQADKYEWFLTQAIINSVKYGAIIGAAIGSLFFSMLCADALGFWYGSKLIEDEYYNPLGKDNLYSAGDVLTIFFSIALVGFNLSQLTPAAQKIAEGYGAGRRIFTIIDRQPQIKNCENPIIPSQFVGIVEFKNVTFAYPKDKKKIILQNFNIVFNSISSALVGQSGCGKSTVMQLILRFYDPDEGQVLLDGLNLKSIDLGWLRKNIGYVGQQPVLFATSIRQNLMFGNSEASENDIFESLKAAEAYQFVMSLQQKLDTNVGYGGGKLSGGQKQRLAIARALLKKPKVLLLDEATSALDRKNQKLIQATLDKVSEGITSITIAHRIRTIMNANIIFIMDKGRVIEKGKFKQLSRYKNIQQNQMNDQLDSQSEEGNKIQQQKKPVLGKGIRGRYLPSLKQAKKGIQNDKIKQQRQQQNKRKFQQGFISQYDAEIQKKSQAYDKSVIFSRLFSYSFSQFHFFLIGLIVSLGNGIIFPLFSIFLAQMITTLLTFKIDPAQARKSADRAALNYVILGIAAFIGYLIQVTLFTYIGQNITKRVRSQTYSKILKMPINWFDKPRNNAGALSSRLSTDCSLVQTLCTIVVAIMVQNFSTLVSGMIIAFVYEWRMALIATGLIPFMVIAGVIQMSFTLGVAQQTDQAYKNSSSMIMEAMINIRTVTSFGYDAFVMEQYQSKLEIPYYQAKKRGIVSGLLYGISQLILYVIFGLIFYLGSLVIRDNYYPTVFQPFKHKDGVLNTFTAIFAIVFAAVTVGNNSHFLPDMAGAMNSAKNLFLIIDDIDENEKQQIENSKKLKKGITGDISVKNIFFKYESRNDYVFKKFNLQIKTGQKIAFVGASGCGKSTFLQLLLRFYDIQSGQININGHKIKDYDIHYLRSCFGVVGQQPVLFNQSFKENILYNMITSDENILQAAKLANALSFIRGAQAQQPVKEQKQKEQKKKAKKNRKTKIANEADLAKQMVGFEKNVGIKGSHISGGQKQRIAIARAILRKPKILLLDEATSALDSVNEQKVQESFDNIMHDKTTLTVAHRLQTIRKSDCIYVFQKGEIKQSGTYQNLLKMQKYFYNLYIGAQFK